MLGEIQRRLPKHINVFIDLFGGSFDVGLNVKANYYNYNDKFWQMAKIIEWFYVTGVEQISREINIVRETYDLSKTNKEGYLKLRNIYNQFYSVKETFHPAMLYMLICHSFNNMAQFNKKGEFNVPFGANKSSFNKSIEGRLYEYIHKLKTLDIEFSSQPFEDIENILLVDNFYPDDFFVYLDPPYLLSDSTYNRNIDTRWSNDLEEKLLKTLDKISTFGVKFMLSNVVESRGTTNTLLKDWMDDYSVHYIDMSYKNCNYQRKTKGRDVEVLVTNY